ncbi:MAG: hypothetical protein FWE91_06285 [Defluviitaleaceae bacterium]|nr:hypothetical protein [Defluviitaleaceae bacterium]MCL2836293.1 hypothetical protein [Defluviitaleaceae bacterium]
MPDFINAFLRDFGIAGEYERILVFGLIVAWLVVLIFRLFLAVGYKGQLQLVRASVKKGIPDMDTARKLKPPLLKRAALDYAELGERGIVRIDSRDLVRKSAGKLRLLWWSWESAGRFLDAVEPALFIAGALFTVVAEGRDVFAALTLILFGVGKLFSTFFDYKQTRQELIDETAFLLDKELGKMYVTDAAGAINNLRGELKGLMTYQAKYLGDTIHELKDKLTAVSEKTLGDTAAAVEKTLKSVAAGADTVLKPLEEWRLAITDSKKAHEELNLSLVKMSTATDGFKERIAELDRLIDGYKAEFLANNKNVENALVRLNALTESVTDICRQSGSQTEAVQGMLEFVRSNQGVLKESMNQYEIALKDISAQAGAGLGKIIEYHAQTSYKALAENAAKSIREAGAVNADLMGKMQNLFDRILEQSKNETALIMNLKEQMELELSDLRAKIVAKDHAAPSEPFAFREERVMMPDEPLDLTAGDLG